MYASLWSMTKMSILLWLLLCTWEGCKVLWSLMSVSPFVRLHTSKTTCLNFTKFSILVTHGHGLVLLWRQWKTLCTSHFLDDVMFSHNGTKYQYRPSMNYSPWLIMWCRGWSLLLSVALLLLLKQIINSTHSRWSFSSPSMLWRCWLVGRKGIRPVKTEWWGTGVVICLQRGANDLHMVQLMPLPPHRLLLQ